MSQNLFGKIRFQYMKLSEKEKRIADYIFEHPEDMIHSTINEVAEILNIAEATVFRFCKRIGFKGFQEMKIALASEIISPIKQIHGEVNEGDDTKTINEKIFHSNVTTLQDTIHVLDSKKVDKVLDFIMKARRVEFYGIGGSAIVAMDAFHKFVRTGIEVFFSLDYHFQLASASRLTKEDVAIFISHSGTNKDTIKMMDAAKKNGAKTVGITGYPKSPIGQQTDVSLFTSSEETEYRSEALSSRIGQLSLIDALYVNIMMLNKNKAKEALAKVREAIATTRL
ncbi:MAG TPA: MurR/RpiR family transcriptional regulator [Bacillales bacterium]|nr:MurR/RpiR family transcriptional regulator [Bacillales bacterium]